MARRLAIGATFGIAWGAMAATVFLAMFRGILPVPGEVGLPIAIGLVVLYLPFVVAAGVEAAGGRGSAPFPEIIGLTLAAGASLGILLSAGVALARGLAWNARARR